jgi:hypothetical protein
MRCSLRRVREGLCRSLLVVGLLLAAGACGSGNDTLTFTIVFDEAQNLKTGQAVTYKDIKIGDVTSVDLGSSGNVKVKVSIQPKYRDQIYKEAWFSVEKPGGMLDLSGERVVAVDDRNVAEKTPIEDGAIIDGYDGWTDQLPERLDRLGDLTTEAASSLRGTLNDAMESYRNSPEAQAFVESMKDFAGKAGSMAQEEFQNFARDQMPKIEEKARSLREKLEEEGKSEKAKEFWDRFKKWKESVQNSSSETSDSSR